MENTVMNQTELISHVEWSLDLKTPIILRDESFEKWYPLYGCQAIVNEHVVHATECSFKHITEEGFISTWYDHVDPMPTSGFILVIEEGYRKEFGVNGSEERWQLNELYSLNG
jgi:hypothetical protein